MSISLLNLFNFQYKSKQIPSLETLLAHENWITHYPAIKNNWSDRLLIGYFLNDTYFNTKAKKLLSQHWDINTYQTIREQAQTYWTVNFKQTYNLIPFILEYLKQPEQFIVKYPEPIQRMFHAIVDAQLCDSYVGTLWNIIVRTQYNQNNLKELLQKSCFTEEDDIVYALIAHFDESSPLGTLAHDLLDIFMQHIDKDKPPTANVAVYFTLLKKILRKPEVFQKYQTIITPFFDIWAISSLDMNTSLMVPFLKLNVFVHSPNGTLTMAKMFRFSSPEMTDNFNITQIYNFCKLLDNISPKIYDNTPWMTWLEQQTWYQSGTILGFHAAYQMFQQQNTIDDRTDAESPLYF